MTKARRKSIWPGASSRFAAILEDIAERKIMQAVAGLRRALLVMHASADAIVSLDHASAIFLAARHPKSFVSLDTADHLLTRREDARYAATVLAAWASRYLPATPMTAPKARSARHRARHGNETG